MLMWVAGGVTMPEDLVGSLELAEPLQLYLPDFSSLKTPVIREPDAAVLVVVAVEEAVDADVEKG